MIKGFVSGKWYRYIGPGKDDDDIVWNDNGKMDFLLDRKPHQCKEGNYGSASFLIRQTLTGNGVFLET